MNSELNLSSHVEKKINGLREEKPSCFLIWDPKDQLEHCDDKLFKLVPGTQDIYVIGRSFKEISRLEFEHGLFDIHPRLTVDQWIDYRSKKREEEVNFELRQGNRWFQFQDETGEVGYTITTIIDIFQAIEWYEKFYSPTKLHQ